MSRAQTVALHELQTLLIVANRDHLPVLEWRVPMLGGLVGLAASGAEVEAWAASLGVLVREEKYVVVVSRGVRVTVAVADVGMGTPARGLKGLPRSRREGDGGE